MPEIPRILLLPLLFQFVMLSPYLSFSQVCNGNLGENIFTEGDFGSGFANVLQTDPGIAPGYTYTTQVPPNDGQYTLSNDMTQWPNAFDWLQISDNSPDPNGYMMIVNASYEPGLFYEQEVNDLCGSTLYEFSADIFNVNAPGDGDILPNVSFLIDGTVVYSTGDVPENGIWNTYGFTFTTDPGQTTVTLALQNNAPGGAGNDLILDNISFRPCGPEALILPTTIADICEDGQPIDLEATIVGTAYDDPQIQWQQSFNSGVTWNDIPGETNLTYTHTTLAAGFYYYRYLLANGAPNLQNPYCRVVSNVKVVHVLPKFITLTDTLCDGLSIAFGDLTADTTGIYIDSLNNYLGCDSIVTLNLTIVPDPGITFDLTLTPPGCNGFEDGSIQLNAITNGFPPFDIFLDGSPVSIGSLVPNLPTGSYPLTISDRFGCHLDTILELIDPLPFSVELGPDLQIDLGETGVITVSGSEPIAQFEWDPASEVDCPPPCNNAYWTASVSGPLVLTAQNAAGCEATDTVFVTVRDIRKVYIPNIFSPDGDGINDRFSIFGSIPNVNRIEFLRVFDRWGNLVYEASGFIPNDTSAGWDGSFRSNQMPEGVYTYIASILFLDGQSLTYAGSVTLIR